MDHVKVRFSIIVPVYNVKEYLPQCLDSLLAQTIQDFEVIVVDDVSTDGSKDVALSYAARYPDKIRVLLHSVNTRQGGARNTGIDAAHGQYLLFVDSDDYLMPNMLERMDQVFTSQHPDIIEFAHAWGDRKGRCLRKEHRKAQTVTHETEDRPLLLSTMGPCNKAYRAELFSNGNIRFPEKYYYEDYWMVPKILLQAKKVVYLDEALYCYRQHEGSTMHDTNVQKNRDIMLGTDELLRYFKECGASSDRLLELEYLAVEHVLINATLRVNRIDRNNPLQKELKLFICDRFPAWKENPYLSRLSKKKQMVLRLIERESYGMLYLRYHCRNRITGAVKQILNAASGFFQKKG